jgi:hypothetical protein
MSRKPWFCSGERAWLGGLALLQSVCRIDTRLALSDQYACHARSRRSDVPEGPRSAQGTQIGVLACVTAQAARHARRCRAAWANVWRPSPGVCALLLMEIVVDGVV